MWTSAIADRQHNREIIAWVGSQIVPHEAGVRARLRRQFVPDAEIDDIVQDAYLALSRLDSVAHIRDPRAYFFTAARNALYQRLRHQRIVRIDSLADAEALAIPDDGPDPERQVSARLELARVRRLIDGLPDRCRQIFEMRRMQGLPQREIAAWMGVTEKIVEAQAIRGLKLILSSIKAEDIGSADHPRAQDPNHVKEDQYDRQR